MRFRVRLPQFLQLFLKLIDSLSPVDKGVIDYVLDRIDILPALKDGDSFCKTAMSRRENVPGCIHVPVVYRATSAANPFSY